MNAKWNIIGSISSPVPVSTITTQPETLINSNFYGYGANGYQRVDTLYPGHGYWIKTKRAGKIILNANSLASNCSLSKPSMESIGSIQIEDAKGRRQILYVTDHAVSQQSLFELPPAPPANTFDVRFKSKESSLFIADGNAERTGIDISSAEYPVTLSWKMDHEIVGLSLHVGQKTVPLHLNGETVSINAQDALTLDFAGSVSMPKQFSLDQNYPNPFNPVTIIKYSLPTDSRVTLKIFNLLGQVVSVLKDEVQNVGYKSVEWNSSNVSSGVYFYRLEATSISDAKQSFGDVKRMMVLK